MQTEYDHDSKKEAELKILYEEFKKSPESFNAISYTEDSDFLRPFGIVIPNKKGSPSVFLKLYASDFIVEEIAPDGTIYTIDESTQLSLPSTPEKYTFFATLVKCNISTLEAMRELSQQLGCNIRDIHYAGLKDKNAITSQRISIHNVSADQLKKISSPYLFLKDIKIDKGSIEKSKLSGNRFTILLRTNDTIDEPRLKAKITDITSNGFFNFYYLQRFGTPRLISHLLGIDILRGNYEKVIKDYFTLGSAYEIKFFTNLRIKMAGVWPDIKKIHNMVSPFPLIMHHENVIAEYLLKNPQDYAGALKQIPDQTLIWVYALASVLFNESLSSFVTSNTKPPTELPLLISNDSRDIQFYEKMLRSIDYYPPQFKNLLPFPNIRREHRTVNTKEELAFDSFKIIPEGIVIRFSLKKGSYATTALAHLFDLLSGPPHKDLSNNRVDTIQAISSVSTEKILNKFKEVDHPRSLTPFEGLKQTLQ